MTRADGQLQLDLGLAIADERHANDLDEYISGYRDPDGHACLNEPTVYSGHKFCCTKRGRMWQMQAMSKRAGLRVPTIHELEDMISACLGLRCRHCGRKMTWRVINGDMARVVSLDHADDGSTRIMCVGCNSISSSGKEYTIDHYHDEAANGRKWCPDCSQFKPFFTFGKNRKNRHGCASICKQCASIRNKKRYR